MQLPAFVLIATIFITLFIGMPVGIAIGVSAVVSMIVGDFPLSQLPKICYGATNDIILMAIPMFLLAGSLMERGGLTKRLINISNSLVGGLRGGLGAVCILSCTIFAAVSGSGPATAAAIGSLMIPSMIKHGYSQSYSCALPACAGGIGIIIPPSIPLIMYSVMAQVSASKLFIAGFIPGIILAICLLIANYIISYKNNYRGSSNRFSFKIFLTKLNEGKWAVLAPILILGGIYGGVVTVTEASVIAVLYALFTGFIIYKQLTLKECQKSLIETLRITGVAFLLLASGRIIARQVVVCDIPEMVATGLLSISNNKIVILLIIDAILIFVGTWMETIAQIIVLTPIFLPLVQQFGVDPIHFGIIFAVACEIGFVTPPLGANIFIVKEIGGGSFEEISVQCLKLAVAEIIGLIIITLLPQLSLYLPELLGS